jgi:hypothetical protein
MAKRRRREYLEFLDRAKVAIEVGIDAFNCVWHPYRNETTLLLLSNAWELLAKAVLLHKKESIAKGQRGETISAEVAIHKLVIKKLIEQDQADTLQQVVSLRNAACHGLLPPVPVEVMQHLLFYSCKFFRELVGKVFPTHLKDLNDNYLSMSFAELTTYADKVQRAVAKVKKSDNDKKLVWLLERGLKFDGTGYITEAQFEQKYRNKKKVLPHLGLSGFMKKSDMVRIVPVQAPKNFTADITLRKGKTGDASLPVLVKKTDLESDYPYLTREVGEKISKNQNWTAKAISVLNLKDDPKYHQAIRASQSSMVHRYSTATVSVLAQKLKDDPTFDPYRVAPQA